MYLLKFITREYIMSNVKQTRNENILVESAENNEEKFSKDIPIVVQSLVPTKEMITDQASQKEETEIKKQLEECFIQIEKQNKEITLLKEEIQHLKKNNIEQKLNIADILLTANKLKEDIIAEAIYESKQIRQTEKSQ